MADKIAHFKFIHQLHYTPAKLNRMGLTKQTCCPRCGEVSANVLHMPWSCPNLSSFWAELFDMLASAKNAEGFPTWMNWITMFHLLVIVLCFV